MSDTIKKDILVSLKIDVGGTVDNINNLSAATDKLSSSVNELKKSEQELGQSTDEQRKKSEANRKAAESAKNTIDAEKGSITQLRQEVKELTKERNSLSTSTEAGSKRIAELNAKIDANNKIIKDNVDSYTKQKIGIGDYTGALDKLVPGLGATTDGIGSMTKASLQFLATPIGAVIGALGLALGTLTAYFKGSEEGQNRLNNLMTIGGQVVEVFTDGIEFLGEKLFGFIEKVLKVALPYLEQFGRLMGINVDAVKDYVNTIIETGNKIAELDQKINEREREILLERANIRKQSAELLIKSQEAEGQERLKYFEQYIALQEQLMKSEQELVKIRLERQQIETEQDPTIENKKKLAELQAELIDKEAEYAEAIRKVNKQRLELQKEINEQILYEKQSANADLIRNEEDFLKHTDQLDRSSLEIRLNNQAGFNEAKNAYAADQAKKEEQQSKKSLELYNQESMQRLRMARVLYNGLGQLLGAFGIRNRGIASGLALINTWLSVTEILKAPTVPFVEPFASINRGIQIAAALASGFNAIRNINSVEGFATSGITGTKIKSSHGTKINRSNGDNLLVTAKVGEVILNERHQAMLGGPATFAKIGVPGFATSGITGGLSSLSTDFISSPIGFENQLSRLVDQVTNQKVVLVYENLKDVQDDITEVETLQKLVG